MIQSRRKNLGAIAAASVFIAFSLPAWGGGWAHLPNEGGSCAARHAGNKVDTLMMLNRDGQLLLFAGHPDWKLGYSGPKKASLRIDGGKAEHLKGNPLGSLFMVLIKSDTTVARLKHAKSLTWHLPSGTYHADVAEFGQALSWVRKCEQEKKSKRQ